MISRICICCGEPFSYKENGGAHNPNICAACSKMTDGEDVHLSCEPDEPAKDASELFTSSAELQNAS